MKRLLFDTDVLIDILRGNKKTLDQVHATTIDAELFCSTISIGEVFAGMKPHEEEKTRYLFSSLNIIPVSSKIAERGGKLKYQTKSHTLWLDDCIIAGTGIIIAAALITKNVKHYPFKDLRILPIR